MMNAILTIRIIAKIWDASVNIPALSKYSWKAIKIDWLILFSIIFDNLIIKSSINIDNRFV
jgi:hypothetical protein